MGKFRLIIESTLLKEVSLDEAFEESRLKDVQELDFLMQETVKLKKKKEAVKWFYTEEGRDARETVVKATKRHILRSIPEI